MKSIELKVKKDTLAELGETINNAFGHALTSSDDPRCEDYWMDLMLSLEFPRKTDITWRCLDQFNTITKQEALLLLLNLPVIDFEIEPEVFLDPITSISCGGTISSDFTRSKELKLLDKSGLLGKVCGESGWDTPINTKDFIDWTLEIGLTRLLEDGNSSDEPNEHGFDQHNKYQKWAQLHNSMVAINAFKQWHIGKNSINSLLEADKFYNSIVHDLVATVEDGDRKPTKNVIKKYLYNYEKFAKKHL